MEEIAFFRDRMQILSYLGDKGCSLNLFKTEYQKNDPNDLSGLNKACL